MKLLLDTAFLGNFIEYFLHAEHYSLYFTWLNSITLQEQYELNTIIILILCMIK
jgi:hypothetical protein